MGFAASTYTVSTPGSLPARITDNGLGCELYVENFVAAGAASGTLTANYLDADNNAKTAVISAGNIISAPVAGEMQMVPLANNRGIKQLTSVVTSATWTSGTFGMTIVKRVAAVPIGIIGTGTIQDWSITALPMLPNDVCLMLFFLAQTTTAAQLIGAFEIIDK